MGLIAPGRFIGLAEETGLIFPIGEWVLRRACQQNCEWQRDGFPAMPVSVNLSARQFSENIVGTIRSILATTGLEPHLLELELGHRPATVQAVPADAMELFFNMGKLCREVDAFIAARAQVTAPLLKVQSFERGLALAGRVAGLQKTLQENQEALEVALKSLNDAWISAPPVGSPGRTAQLPLARVEDLYRAFSYLGRWRAQLQERFVQLSM